MTKNNIGEAILMSIIIFCALYFDLKIEGYIFLAIIFLIPLFTWVKIDSKTRETSNNFAMEEARLKNEKLRLEIKKLKKELEE